MRRVVFFLCAVLVSAAWTVPSYAAETTIDGTWRIRAFAFENMDFDDDTADPSSYIDQRFRLGVISRASEDFGGFLQIQSGNDDWGTAFDPVSLNQAYLDFNVQNVNVKVGKQDFGVPDDIFNLVLIETFDAIVASTQVGPADVYAAYIKDEENDKDDGAADDDRNAYALGAQFSPAQRIEAGVFWVHLADNMTPTKINWFGANGSFMVGPVDISVEGVILTGKDDTNDTTGDCPGSVDCDYSGWTLVGEGTFSVNDQLSLGLVAGIASGDNDDTDNDMETYFGAYPSFNQSDILFDDGDGANGGATNPGVLPAQGGDIGGTIILKPYVTFEPIDNLILRGQYGWFRYTEEKESILYSNTGTGDEAIGSEIDLQADYVIHTASKLGLRAQANWFFPGDGALTATTAKDDAISEYFVRLQYEF